MKLQLHIVKNLMIQIIYKTLILLWSTKQNSFQNCKSSLEEKIPVNEYKPDRPDTKAVLKLKIDVDNTIFALLYCLENI